MPRNSISDYIVEDPVQLEALASPKRVEIVDLVTALGECSAAEIAREMGVAPDSIYYHLKKLTAVGLLETVGKRASTTRHEVIYRVPGALNLRYAGVRDGAALMKKAVTSVLRLSRRDFERALDRGESPHDGLSGGREVGWLSRADLKTLNAHLDAIRKLMRESKRGRGRSHIGFTWTVTPFVRR